MQADPSLVGCIDIPRLFYRMDVCDCQPMQPRGVNLRYYIIYKSNIFFTPVSFARVRVGDISTASAENARIIPAQ